jgi:hypothetical protein
MVTTKIQSFTGDIKVVDDLTAGSTLYVDTTNDRVGINSTTPAIGLDVTSSVNTDPARIGDAAATSNALTLRNTNGDFVFRPKVGSFLDSDLFIIKGNGSLDKIKLNNAIYLTGDGKLSTNANPIEEFEIKPGNTTDVFKVGNLEIGNVLGDGAHTGIKHVNATDPSFYINNTNGDLTLKVPSNQIMTFSNRGRFDASGNLGIGTNTPRQKLDIYNQYFVSERTIVKSQHYASGTDYATSSTSFQNAGTYTFDPISVGGKDCTFLVTVSFLGSIDGYFGDSNKIRIYNATTGVTGMIDEVEWYYDNNYGGGARGNGNCLSGTFTHNDSTQKTINLQIRRVNGDDAIRIYHQTASIHQITGYLD